MAYWNNSATEIDKMTVKEFLDYLTDINYHTERCVVEAILSMDMQAMREACAVWVGHQAYGYMPSELVGLRNKIYDKLEKERQ